MCDIVVRAYFQSLAIQGNRLVAICRQLRLVKIFTKGANAISLFLILNFLASGERFKFFALTSNLHFLLLDLLCLAFERLVEASRRYSGYENHRRQQAKLSKAALHRR